MDIFPSAISSFVKPLEHPISSGGFKELDRRFKPVWQASKITVREEKICFNPVDEWNEQSVSIFFKTRKDSYLPNEFRPKSVTWKKVISSLKRGSLFTKEKTKNNLIYKYGNFYLANALFTFGQRYVRKGTNHIYQTTTVPMLLYLLPSTPENPVPIFNDFDLARRENRALKANDQVLYHLHVLEPNRVYKIPERKYYLIVTTQCTMFSVHVILSNTLLPFSLCRDPSKSKNWNRKELENRRKSTQFLLSSNSSKSSCDHDGSMTNSSSRPQADCTIPSKTQAYSFDEMIDPIKDLVTPSMNKQVFVEAFHKFDIDSLYIEKTVSVTPPEKYSFPSMDESVINKADMDILMDILKADMDEFSLKKSLFKTE